MNPIFLWVLCVGAVLASCGRIEGDVTTTCGYYYEIIGEYFSVGRVGEENQAIGNGIAQAQSGNYNITQQCIGHLNDYLCARAFVPCVPDDGTGQTDIQRRVQICKTSCEALLSQCPNILLVPSYSGLKCDANVGNLELDLSKPCFDFFSMEIANDGYSVPGGDSSWATCVTVAIVAFIASVIVVL